MLILFTCFVSRIIWKDEYKNLQECAESREYQLYFQGLKEKNCRIGPLISLHSPFKKGLTMPTMYDVCIPTRRKWLCHISSPAITVNDCTYLPFVLRFNEGLLPFKGTVQRYDRGTLLYIFRQLSLNPITSVRGKTVFFVKGPVRKLPCKIFSGVPSM